MKNKIPLIMDVDTGIDDAVALVFAGHLKNLDLRLITTVFGNVELKQVIKNTLIIAEDMKRTDVPILIGAENPIENTDFNISAHGKNGLGNYSHNTSLTTDPRECYEAIHQEVNQRNMTYWVACGPLTNLAKFIQLYPQDNDKITVVLVTGLLDIDKKSPYLNFNIQKDIKACEIVLKKYKNIVIVPSDMGHISYIPQTDFVKTAKCGRIGEILANMFPYHLDRTVKNGAAMHDLCGVLFLSNPKLFNISSCKCTLRETKKGSYLDFNFNSKSPNAIITTSINVKKTHKLYYKTLKHIK